MEKLKKLEKEYTTARPTYHRFNYNRLRVKQATRQANTYQWNIQRNAKRLCYRSLPSFYFQKLGCQEAQVTDTIIPYFFFFSARCSKDAWFYMVNVPGNVNLSANRIRYIDGGNER